MPSYRFCRPDDIPLLVEAVNIAYRVHFPDEPLCSNVSFKQEIRELNLWTSSCMIAMEGKEIIGVCIGCKREKETLIYKVGVHPHYQRQGHGRHLLTSLQKKFSVLGPPRIVAEVPSDLKEANSFFRELGFAPGNRVIDYEFQETLKPLSATDFIQELSLAGLIKAGVALDSDHLPWCRSRETLMNMKDHIKIDAIVTSDRIEAFLLYHLSNRGGDQAGILEILRYWFREQEKEPQLCLILLRKLTQLHPTKIRVPKLAENDPYRSVLEDIGFQPTRQYVRYSCDARAL